MSRLATEHQPTGWRHEGLFEVAELLAGREGVALRGVVIEQREDGGIVQLAEPAITARCRGKNLPLGEWVDAWLVEADPKRRSVVFDVSQRRP